jgi:hypothetical protein
MMIRSFRTSVVAASVLLRGLVASAAPPALESTTEAESQEMSRFFIVAPERFHSELTDYVRHKQKLLKTELVSLEQTLKSSDGVDDPERPKRFLHEAWHKRHLKYVLLVGDVDVLPVRKNSDDDAPPGIL